MPPPMVDEVHAYMKEMLGSWCNSPKPEPMVQCCCAGVQEGWRSACFCTDLHKLNVRTKKDSYPIPQIQEATESLVGTGYFSCLDLKQDFGRSPWMRLQNSKLFLL